MLETLSNDEHECEGHTPAGKQIFRILRGNLNQSALQNQFFISQIERGTYSKMTVCQNYSLVCRNVKLNMNDKEQIHPDETQSINP